MTSAEVIPAVVLKRKAVVYVRQSTQSQVMTNLESKRRQYDLVDVARQRVLSMLKSSMMISAARHRKPHRKMTHPEMTSFQSIARTWKPERAG
jgi:hypothetical protein